MIDRGLESFVDAVKACQAKGVVAVVVRNVASSGGGENDLIVMGAAEKDGGVHIPSVFVSRKTGDELDVLLAMNPTVFVELFAADDVNSIMAYIAYLIMSVETLFFAVVFFTIVIVLGSRKRMNRGRCCRRKETETRAALLVNDSSLLEPLQPTRVSSVASDPESKPPKDGNAQAIQSYPVVFANGAVNERTVSLRVDPNNEEPLFEQQEQ